MRPRRLISHALIAATLAALLSPALASADRTPRIIRPAGTGDPVPWHVALQGPTGIFCGGTLRDARHVITAAHCLRATDRTGKFRVVAGITNRNDDEPEAVVREVAAVSSFPGYAGDRGDVAVLELDGPPIAEVDGEIEYLPVVDPDADVPEPVDGPDAIIAGFGVTADHSNGSPDLNHAFVKVWDDAKCSATNSYGAEYDPATMVCAGWFEEGDTQAVDACQGDSGGGLARTDDSGDIAADVLLGVVSFGKGCGLPQYPGVYADLSNEELNAYATGSVGQRPVLTRGPVVRREGAELVCDPGAWDGDDDVTQRWERGRRVSDTWQGTPIAGASGLRYTTAASDAGKELACVERAANDWGEPEAFGSIKLPPPPKVTPPTGPPVSMTIPSVDVPIETRPHTRLAARSCKRGRCRVTVRIADAGGLAGMRVAATLQRVTGCRTRRQRRTKACRPQAIVARRLAEGRFSLDTRKLRPGTYRLTVVAADAGGTKQQRPTVITLRAKR